MEYEFFTDFLYCLFHKCGNCKCFWWNVCKRSIGFRSIKSEKCGLLKFCNLHSSLSITLLQFNMVKSGTQSFMIQLVLVLCKNVIWKLMMVWYVCKICYKLHHFTSKEMSSVSGKRNEIL